jgi:hypothetical protein
MKIASRLKLGREGQLKLVAAAQSTEPVTGLTHDFYKYPARFSPTIARAAIELFTQPGEIVLDPFAGGGTALVEASAHGRAAVGSDISELATFVSRVKTTSLTAHDREEVKRWINTMLTLRGVGSSSHIIDSRLRNFEGATFWRLRSVISEALDESETLRLARQKAFARCVLLRTSQALLDCKTTTPTLQSFRQELLTTGARMLRGAEEYSTALQEIAKPHSVKVWTTPAEKLHERYSGANNSAPALIVTSPPYAGVHVLYHRWQLFGRRETPLPFWIANANDGHGASFFTLGDRHERELNTYFERATTAFAAVRRTMSAATLLLQVVAFADPIQQLPRYLSVLRDAGLRECKLDVLSRDGDGRLWRQVPGRKWYAQKSTSKAKFEVVLLHHKD